MRFLKMAALWCVAFSALCVPIIVTMRMTYEFGMFASGILSAAVGLGAFIGVGFLLQWIEDKFNIKIVERWEDYTRP